MADPVGDDLTRHYASRIRGLIPAVYWNEDVGGALEAIVEAVAGDLATLRRSHDRTWENQTPELADDWALAYLGDLLAVRPVPSLDVRGRRISVAKAIAYRRRAGTRQVLEEVAADVSGWPTVAREAMLRLVRAPHRLDVPSRPSTVDLRSRRAGFLRGTAHELGARLVDVRRTRGEQGLYALAKVLLHQFMTPVHVARGVTPGSTTAGDGTALATFDPSGRRAPLFAPHRPPNYGADWRSAHWTELPQRMRCPMLGDESYAVTDEVIERARGLGLGATELRALTRMRSEGMRVTSGVGLSRVFEAAAPGMGGGSEFEALRRAALEPTSGRGAFVVGSPERDPAFALYDGTGLVDAHTIRGADLGPGLPSGAPADPLVDPSLGLIRAAGLSRVDYAYGWPGPVGASHHVRGGAALPATAVLGPGVSLDPVSLASTGVYEVAGDETRTMTGPLPCSSLRLRGTDGARPFIRLDADVVVSALGEYASLTVEGLWLGATADRRLILRGAFEDVTFRHCTLDPGEASMPAHAVDLVVEGSVERLTIDHCVFGRVAASAGAHLGELRITSCAVLPGAGTPGIETSPGTRVDLVASTVARDAVAHRLHATDSLMTGAVSVTDLQNGCFRYSAARSGEQLPRPYRAVRFDADAVAGMFVSTRLSDPRWLQLSGRAPHSLRVGSERREEIGVWSLRRDRAKQTSIEAKLREFIPVGLIAVHRRET